MNPHAFVEMAVKSRTQFIHPENIGGLNYIAAYEPVRNINNETEGFIGLPYFQKQEELKRELSSFIGSLMNLYMLLLAAALAAAYFILHGLQDRCWCSRKNSVLPVWESEMNRLNGSETMKSVTW
jgi:hypothetical protein